MKICIIGSGYVGLVTGACFAKTGNTVYCVDKDESKIALLKDGVVPIYEPGLKELVLNGVKQQRLHFTTNLADAINEADVSFIAVGTPQDEDGSADLKYVKQVCEEICEVATKKVVIATKSTVPVGTGDKIEKIFKERLRQEYVVFSNPEFLKEGDAVNDFMHPDRIVVGTNDNSITDMIKELYSPFINQRNRILFMERKSAELAKYAANAMLALRVSYMNEVANLCDAVGANINDVRLSLGTDPRIGPKFLNAGIGYGGSCFPKDVRALIKTAHDYDVKLPTVEACHLTNQNQVQFAYEKIKKTLSEQGIPLNQSKMAIWGLAFKSNTDDIRESRSLALADMLIAEGAKLHVYDTKAMPNVKAIYGDRLNYHENKMDCLESAEVLVVATDWDEFKSPDFKKIKKSMHKPVIVDGRNLYNPKHLKELGFHYTGMGIK
jgi:UDPglucose 6-dehydrogenase